MYEEIIQDNKDYYEAIPNHQLIDCYINLGRQLSEACFQEQVENLRILIKLADDEIQKRGLEYTVSMQTTRNALS